MNTNVHYALKRFCKLAAASGLTFMLLFSSVGDMAEAQRRGGSFGGGRSSFGGGSFGGSRSSGGSFGRSGSFGGSSGGGFFGSSRSSRSSGGSFGSSSGGSFGRSGSFGSGRSGGSFRTSTTAPSTFGRRPTSTSTYYVNGRSVPGYSYGFWSGYSLGWAMSPPWYYYTPFHPAFYFHRPVYYNGGLYPGGFNWLNFIIGLVVLGFIVWLVFRLFARPKGVRYTTYN